MEPCCTCCAQGEQDIMLTPCKHACCQACFRGLITYSKTNVSLHDPCSCCCVHSISKSYQQANRQAPAADVKKPAQYDNKATLDQWTCQCGSLNTNFSAVCQKCHGPVYLHEAQSALLAIKKEKYLNPAQLLQLAISNGLRVSFDAAFEEAGMQIAWKWPECYVEGTTETFLRAVSLGFKLDSLHSIVTRLIGHKKDSDQTLIFHWFGNRTLQLLISAAGKIRSGVQCAKLQGKRSTLPFITPDEMHDVLHGKYNLLGHIVDNLIPFVPLACRRQPGTYVLQCLLDSPCTFDETIQIAEALIPVEVPEADPPDEVFQADLDVLVKLADMLNWVVFNANLDSSNRASELLNNMFKAFHLKQRFLSPVPAQPNLDSVPADGFMIGSMPREHTCFHLLLKAIEGALHTGGSTANEIALKMADGTQIILAKPDGPRFVKGLLLAKAESSKAIQIKGIIVCRVSHQFKGAVVDTLLQLVHEEPHVILVLAQQMDVHAKKDLQWLVEEMIKGAVRLESNPAALDIVCYTLALLTLSDEYVARHLRGLSYALKDHKGFTADVHHKRLDNKAKDQWADPLPADDLTTDGQTASPLGSTQDETVCADDPATVLRALANACNTPNLNAEGQRQADITYLRQLHQWSPMTALCSAIIMERCAV